MLISPIQAREKEKEPVDRWLQENREIGSESFSLSGYPDKKNEAWKYTDLTEIIENDFDQLDISTDSLQKIGYDLDKQNEIKKFYSLNASPSNGSKTPKGISTDFFLFINGVSASKDVQETNGISYAGGSIFSLDKVIHSKKDFPRENSILSQNLGKSTQHEKSPFVALNMANWKDGLGIHLPENTSCQKPIHSVFFNHAKIKNTVLIRNLIILEANSSLIWIEDHHSMGDVAHLQNIFTEIILKPGSKLEHYKVQKESTRGYHIASTHVSLHKDSFYESNLIMRGGKIARNEIHAQMKEPGGNVKLNGLYRGKKTQHLDHYLAVDHLAPHCTSSQYYRGTLDDQSRGVFQGKIYISPAGLNSKAEQSNHTILLSENARADSRPQLEIFTDDVKCSHGATIGNIDKEALFYLKSRGVSGKKAEEILIMAFNQEIMEKFGNPQIAEALDKINSKC